MGVRCVGISLATLRGDEDGSETKGGKVEWWVWGLVCEAFDSYENEVWLAKTMLC